MFTGIVQDVGRVEAVEPADDGGRSLAVRTSLDVEDFEIGESIAVDGACLTVREVRDSIFEVDLSPETLARTTLDERDKGDGVHLERALRAGDRLGGHFVQGHVDGVGAVESRAEEGEGSRIEVRVPEDLAPYLVEKGSVAVDGVSLTVAELSGASFAVAIVPHTEEVTKFGGLDVGASVNVEVDMLGKYVARLMQTGEADTH